MAEFCADDDRLMGVGDRSARRTRHSRWPKLDWALEDGLDAMWVPHRPAGDRVARPRRPRPVLGLPRRGRHCRSCSTSVASPLQLAEGVGEHRPCRRARLDGRRRERAQQGRRRRCTRARDVPLDDGDGRRVRATSRACAARRSSSVPAGCPQMLRAPRLGDAHVESGRPRPVAASRARRPSSSPSRWGSPRSCSRTSPDCVDESNDDLYLFSSDYPHTEGGRDPIGRFEKVLERSTRPR